MRSNTRSKTSVAETATDSPGEPGAAELAELAGCARQADRLLARAVELAGRLAGSGACESHEGLPLEQFVALAARMTGADARMLVTAGDVLRDLPLVAGLFAEGALGWGQVRAIVLGAKRLRAAERAVVDERVAATVAAHEPGVEAFDPDGLVWAVDAAVDELRPATVDGAERRAPQQAFLARQMSFDGWMRCFGELDPVSAATLNNALDARMGRPPAGRDTDGAGGDMPRDAGDAGDGSGGASVDAGDGRWSPGRPLAASDKVSLRAIPEKTRLAVAARDRGCRFPGSPDPIGFTDLDHVVERARGGTHHPDLLVAISRRFHTLRHRHGWTLTLAPGTGMLTIRRGGRRFHSLPRGAQLARPPNRTDTVPR